MSKAASKAHTTNPPAAATDPVLKIAHEIERLWDAEHGAECERFAAKKNDEVGRSIDLKEQCSQIVEWREALETVGSYAVATSMPGALVQLAWITSDMETLLGAIEAREAGEVEPSLAAHVIRVQRMVKSVGDVVLASLGDGYGPYRRIVETYSSLGDRGPNWLNSIDNWIDQAWLERERAIAVAEKEANAGVAS